MNQENNTFYGIGRRKQAIAQVLLKVGTGKLTINGKPGELYLQENITYLNKINNPFQVLGLENEYDVNVKAHWWWINRTSRCYFPRNLTCIIRIKFRKPFKS